MTLPTPMLGPSLPALGDTPRRPTDAEFDALKRRRDEGLQSIIAAAAEQLFGADPSEITAHIDPGGGTHECYCACPDGPCQHIWDGPERLILDDRDRPCGSEATCSRCSMGAMAHSMRTGL